MTRDTERGTSRRLRDGGFIEAAWEWGVAPVTHVSRRLRDGGFIEA